MNIQLKKNICILSFLALLTSCDAYLRMPYVVKNCRSDNVSVKITDYLNEQTGEIVQDTVVQLKPNETITVATTIGIGFPWDNKKLFNNNPGVQNFQTLDSLEFDNSDKYWTYKKKSSIFKIK